MTTLHRPRSILVVLGALLLLVLATPTADARMPYTTPYRVGGPITLDTNLRSTSGASAWAINEFLASATSLPPLGAAFIGAERTFGVNARFLLAAAMHESGWGSSDIARVKHNLFGYNAYDRDPFRYASAYRTFAANIDATAKFIRDFYLTPGGRWWGGAPTLRAMQQYWSSSQKWGVSISRLASSIILPAIRGRSLDFATPVVGDQPRSGDRTTVLLAWAGGTVPSGVDFVATWIPVERAAGPAAPAAGGGLQGVAVPAAIGAMEGAAPSPSSPSAVERPAPAGAPFAAAASRQRSAARSVTLDVPTPGQPGAYTLRVDMRDADGSPLPAAQRVSIPDAEVRVLGDLEVRVDIVPSPDGDGAAILVTNTGRDAIPAAAAAPAQTPDASAVGEDGSASSRTVVSVAAAPGPADGPLVPLLSEALVDDLQPGATVAFPVTGVSALTGRTVNWLSVSVSALGDPTPSAPDAPSGAWLVSTNAAATAGPPRPEAALYPAPPVALAPPHHPYGAGGHAVAAAVADVVLDDDGAELGTDQRTGWADVEAGGVRAVLADVRRHQPAQLAVARVGCGCVGLDERDVAPGVPREPPRVVEGHPGEAEAVVGDAVPLLAGDLAGLAADADRGVGEKAHAFKVCAVAGRVGGVAAFEQAEGHAPGGARGRFGHGAVPVSSLRSARRW